MPIRPEGVMRRQQIMDDEIRRRELPVTGQLQSQLAGSPPPTTGLGPGPGYSEAEERYFSPSHPGMQPAGAMGGADADLLDQIMREIEALREFESASELETSDDSFNEWYQRNSGVLPGLDDALQQLPQQPSPLGPTDRTDPIPQPGQYRRPLQDRPIL